MIRLALYHIETMIWIGKLGTFSAAAERLNTTQPTISARVREIENHFGFPLFAREGRGVALTVRGRQIVSEMESLWVQFERTLAPSDGADSITGILRVGCGEIAAVLCLPQLLSDLKKTMPRLQLEAEIDISMNLHHKLEAGQLDLALLVGPVLDRSLLSQRIGTAELCWFLKTDTSYRPSEHSDHDVLVRTPVWSLPRLSHLHQHIVETLESAGVPLTNINTCNNIRTMIDIVVSGGGTAMLPTALISTMLDDGVVERIMTSKNIYFDFYCAIRRGSKERAIAEVFDRAAKVKF
jgi:DNA-binding transcriptional LysR family regulator